ncbi:MAG: prolipoprotein diacylglyceryl transferase [Bacteroidales bacterium]|nr:prolipoprotein diacylglyceryl transferase [Bacteroidales bacterium]MCR5277664.1 prolipoprotein diacylglyceryl transferase [Bacteroidales bacterium]
MLDLLYVRWNIDPVLIHIGQGGIRYYGLMFILGFTLGWYMFQWFCKREKLPVSLLDPLLITLVVATIVGARLGHCLFYQPDYYLGSWQGFLEIFMPWKGGLASHGGAIALILAMWWFSAKYGRKHNFDFLWIMDHLVIPVAFVGCFIRLGNLFNSEIYGDVTTLPWGFIFERNGETLPKHPTQIYEALSYLILGLILTAIYKWRLDKTWRGTFFGLFLIGCFGMRFLIEFIKEPQVGFEESMALNMGQLLSIPFVIAGICLLVYAYRKKIPAAVVHPETTARKKEATHYARSINSERP